MLVTPKPTHALSVMNKWEFPKIRGPFLGVPIIRIIVFWGLYWGPLILGNYQILRNCWNFGRVSSERCLSVKCRLPGFGEAGFGRCRVGKP